MKYLRTIAMIEFETFIVLHWLPDIFIVIKKATITPTVTICLWRAGDC